jgi:hypothetical protein
VDDSVIHDVVVVAVHVHPGAAATVTCPVAPVPGTLRIDGVSVKLHDPFWLTVNV